MNRIKILLAPYWNISFSGMKRSEEAKKKYPDSDPTKRFLALTFDDGPHPEVLTPLLKLLRKEGIPATFFVKGSKADAHPQLLQTVAQEGHLVGNHSYEHVRLDRALKNKGKTWIWDDIERCSRTIQSNLGYAPRFFRPPYWKIDRHFYWELVEGGYIVQILDNLFIPQDERAVRDVNTVDYEFERGHSTNPVGAASALAKNVERLLKRREVKGIYLHILVFHELPVSLNALGLLIPSWKGKYTFCLLKDVWGRNENSRSFS